MKIDGTISEQRPRRFIEVTYEVTVTSSESDETVKKLALKAAEDCYVTNTLKRACPVTGVIIHNGIIHNGVDPDSRSPGRDEVGGWQCQEHHSDRAHTPSSVGGGSARCFERLMEGHDSFFDRLIRKNYPIFVIHISYSSST
jgi:hypothetical protein